MTMLTRRHALTLLGGLAVASTGSVASAQGVVDRKFVFVILRGALDGLAALMPDDPYAEEARGSILPPQNKRLSLVSGFQLHPSLANLQKSFQAGEAAFVHACATPYRERSHFDGQDFLERLGEPGEREGWLNRALQVLPSTEGLGIGPSLPMVLRGSAEATNWSPSVFAPATDDLLNRLQKLYTEDPDLANALATARQTDMDTIEMGGSRQRPQDAARNALSAAGKLMAVDGGPGIGVVAVDGWDTHAAQARLLTQRLSDLDEGLVALKDELGIHWGKTVVVIASEFGRTFRANGTDGSDHGTGGLVTLLGGAVRGGKIYGDWPGLGPGDLYENRDLFPANNMVAVFKGVLRDHLGIDRSDLDHLVFPGSEDTMNSLIKS